MKLIAIVVLFVLDTSLGYTIKSCKYDAYDSDEPSDSFKCYNGGICFRVENNSSSVVKICSCKPGFTGKQCEQSTLTPCSPDPCSPNGYCNAESDGIGHYCQCKPGFAGPTCAENINDCLNATCFNGGLCIDGINSYQCDCEWPYIGRYCQSKMKCSTEGICKNGGVCVEEAAEPKCVCKRGYAGVDCSTRIDHCRSAPCLKGSCVSLLDDYRCDCPIGYTGKNCDQEDVCAVQKPCLNNATCVSVGLGSELKYFCQCATGFTGPHCGSHLTTTSTPTTTFTIPSYQQNTTSHPNETDGAFVLLVNIAPSEFTKRQSEIITEFEKRFGILMSIKKNNHHHDMIYPFRPKQDSDLVWTKVYFIFISACIQNDFGQVDSHLNGSKSLCLQNNVQNINNVNEVLEQLKKSSDLFPKYVSNVSYEAYTDSKRKHDKNFFGNRSTDSSLTITLCFLSIALLVGISLALTVIIRQQKRVKAPIWFPPLGDTANEKFDTKTISANFVCDQTKKMSTSKMNADHWSLGKQIDHLTTKFFTKQKSEALSPENDYGDMDLAGKPVKMRKLDSSRKVNVSPCSTASSCLTIAAPAVPGSPDFYPSPPESLPESCAHTLHPVNYKAGSFGLTPLMLFVIGRSKNKQNESNYAEIVDSFVNSGADLNTRNNDGETALHLAARCGLYEICHRLIRHKAELSLFDNYGRNVLHTAVSANEYKIVKLILDHCNSMLCASNMMNQANLLLDEKYDLIDSKTNDELGDTSLIIASRLSLNSIVQLLIDYNATVNATDNEGRSALHWCAKVNNESAASILLKSGANVNMQDNDEKTPLTSGLNEMCTLQVADLLIKYDAFVSADDEIKYNKMKSIMESMSGMKSMPRDIKTIKSSVVMAPPDKVLKSAPTKRKLNETAGSSGTLESRGVKNKKPSVKKPSSPSPPPYTVQPVYSAKYSYGTQYAQDTAPAYDYSSYYYDSSYSFSNQQFYLNPVADNTGATSAGNVNMGYTGDVGYNFGTQFQIKQEVSSHSQQGGQVYPSQYAAYF